MLSHHISEGTARLSPSSPFLRLLLVSCLQSFRDLASCFLLLAAAPAASSVCEAVGVRRRLVMLARCCFTQIQKGNVSHLSRVPAQQGVDWLSEPGNRDVIDQIGIKEARSLLRTRLGRALLAT